MKKIMITLFIILPFLLVLFATPDSRYFAHRLVFNSLVFLIPYYIGLSVWLFIFYVLSKQTWGLIYLGIPVGFLVAWASVILFFSLYRLDWARDFAGGGGGGMAIAMSVYLVGFFQTAFCAIFTFFIGQTGR